MDDMNSWMQWAAVLGLAALCMLFVVAGLGLAYEDEGVIVRIYILFGAIGILSVARWFARMLWPEEWKALEFENRN